VGQVTPVHAFTSGDEAELFLNGRSLGKRKKAAGQYRLRWDEVIYEPGELKLQAYKDGKPWADASVATAGTAAVLALQADRSSIAADGSDLGFVTLRITDATGRTVPRADARIRFSVDGPGDIVATDNGDASSFEPFPSHSRKAFSGQALVIVRGRPGAAGTLTVRAQADGLAPAEIKINTQEMP
jgi:beta-galactosidase